jgi:hypothetical protein
MAALAIAVPGLAQQGPATKFDIAKLTRKGSGEGTAQDGYVWACGSFFRCYTGVPLNCTPQTRPYQNVAAHICLCIHAGCPQ